MQLVLGSIREGMSPPGLGYDEYQHATMAALKAEPEYNEYTARLQAAREGAVEFPEYPEELVNGVLRRFATQLETLRVAETGAPGVVDAPAASRKRAASEYDEVDPTHGEVDPNFVIADFSATVMEVCGAASNRARAPSSSPPARVRAPSHQTAARAPRCFRIL